jgi:hypothetical protein
MKVLCMCQKLGFAIQMRAMRWSPARPIHDRYHGYTSTAMLALKTFSHVEYWVCSSKLRTLPGPCSISCVFYVAYMLVAPVPAGDASTTLLRKGRKMHLSPIFFGKQDRTCP